MKWCYNLHQAPFQLFVTILSALLLFRATLVHARADVQFAWSVIDYSWPSSEQRLRALQNEDYIEANNAIAGIKVYRNWVYLTVPRWLHGVPSTLNRVSIDNRETAPRLIPYPNWHMNEVGDCDALQYVQSIEIVPHTVEIENNGTLWAIDVGRVNIFEDGSRFRVNNKCAPKIVIFHIDSGTMLAKYQFPDSVVSYTKNFLNDIAVDPRKAIAYISNPMESSIVVFNWPRGISHKIQHASMRAVPSAMQFYVNGFLYNSSTAIDGISLSPDFSQVYYCALSGYTIYALPTKIAAEPSVVQESIDRVVQPVVNKTVQTDGIIWSKKKLYFGALPDNQVRVFEPSIGSIWNVTPPNENTLEWPDSFAIDDRGYLWLTTNRLPKFFKGLLRFGDPTDANFRVWKVYIGEDSYVSKSSRIDQMPLLLSFVLITLVLSHGH